MLQSECTICFQNNDKEPGSNNDEDCFDLVGNLLLFLIICANLVGIPISTLICYIGIDPIQATFQHLLNVSPNPYTFVFSSICSTLGCVCSCVREMFIISFFGVALFVRIRSELVALSSYSLLHSEFVCGRYILLRRQHLIIEEAFSLITACVVIFGQVLHSVAIWIVFICWKLIPLYLVVSCIFGFFVTLGGLIFGLQTQSSCLISSETLLIKHVDGFHVYGISGGKFGKLKRIWKCQLPLRFYCGKHFLVSRDAIINYLDVLTNNVTNLVVLIKV